MRPAIIDGHFTIDPSTASTFGGAVPEPGATVCSLSILVDEQGTSAIDNVTLNEVTLR